MPMFAVMGGMALANMAAQKEQADQARKDASITQRYSPWTGMKAATPPTASALGGLASGAATGASMYGGYENAKTMGDLQKAQTAYYNRATPGQAGTEAIAGLPQQSQMGQSQIGAWPSMSRQYMGQPAF